MPILLLPALINAHLELSNVLVPDIRPAVISTQTVALNGQALLIVLRARVAVVGNVFLRVLINAQPELSNVLAQGFKLAEILTRTVALNGQALPIVPLARVAAVENVYLRVLINAQPELGNVLAQGFKLAEILTRTVALNGQALPIVLRAKFAAMANVLLHT